MEYVVCNLCGSDRSHPFLQREDLSLGLGGMFRLCQCDECGLVYLNPRPTREEIIRYYPEEYDQFNPAMVNEPSFISRWDRHYGLRKRCRAILDFKSSGRLLDIGCATGDFIHAMQRYHGWEVYGVEISPFAAQYAREHLGLEVVTGTVEEAQWPAAFFDVVTLWNVFEHLFDPWGSLRGIHRVLKDDGLLTINTPNLDSFDAKLFGRYWIGFELPRHLYVFSENTLTQLLTDTGFRVVKRRCLYGSHAALASSFRFWVRANIHNPTLRQIMEELLFLRIVRLLAAPYFFIMDRLLNSTAVTVFCKKGYLRSVK
jgi:2-polyprenyl-3-methyl-5-hydroxy-6-metoxy-1,4-benzoquinol methylase